MKILSAVLQKKQLKEKQFPVTKRKVFDEIII